MRAILGVTGCIAAYKSAFLLRRLQQEGFEVVPVLTRHAREFITPLTLEKLAGHRAVSDLFGEEESAQIQHISLARQSDVLIVAPATANVLGKFAHGIADDFLTTLYISTATPVLVAPGMNVEMWRHRATQSNLRILRVHGVRIVEPEPGYLACGEVGEGRMAEPERILDALRDLLVADDSLKGRRVLVTAGPTVEDIDPVRFISNRKTGKMGYALAREARRRNASVVLVSGPTALDPPAGVDLVCVRSASEMEAQVESRFADSDIVVMSAAVSDFRPAAYEEQKIKKHGAETSLRLQKTPDILEGLGRRKEGQFLVGFAAESEDLLPNAAAKLERKNLDMIVANDITIEGAGFGSENNRVTILRPGVPPVVLEMMSKVEVASRVLEAISSAMGAGQTASLSQHELA